MLRKSLLAASAAFALTSAAPAPAPAPVQDWNVCSEVVETYYGKPVWVPIPTQAVEQPPYAGWENAGGSPVIGGSEWVEWGIEGSENDPSSDGWGVWDNGVVVYGGESGGHYEQEGGYQVWVTTQTVHINPHPSQWMGSAYNGQPWAEYTATCSNTLGVTSTQYGAGGYGGGWEVWATVTTGSNGVPSTVTVTATDTATVSAIITGTTTTSNIADPTISFTTTTISSTVFVSPVSTTTTTTTANTVNPILTGTTSTTSTTATTDSTTLSTSFTTTTISGTVVISPTLITTTASSTTDSTTLSTSFTTTTISGTVVISPTLVTTTASSTTDSTTLSTSFTTTTISGTVVISPTLVTTTASSTTDSTTASTTDSTTLTTSFTTTTISGTVVISPTLVTTTASSTTDSTTLTTSFTTTTISGTVVISPTVVTSTSTTTDSTITTTTAVTTSTTSTTTSASTTATGPCATMTGVYVFQASGTGDFAVDGNFAQLQTAFGSGYRVSFSANRQNAQQFMLTPDCTLETSDGNLQAMIGGNANLHYQYFFPSVQDASALINVNWETDVCTYNADNTLSCTAMSQSIFQITPGETLLQLGDQNYGEQVTINLVPVPGSVFK